MTGPADDNPPAANALDTVVMTQRLTKKFKSQTAVNAIDLRVPRGSVYGFLGPNGSGKTTTLRMLLALVRPTSGHCELLGRSIPEQALTVLPRVGALVEGPAFHPYLSGRANLARLDAADLSVDPSTSRRRVDAALDRVGLLVAAEKRFRAYSLGMKQRLAIAGALLAPRELLVLDEPTNGLDPQGTREVRHLVSSLAEEGVTVLISSHLLSEVEQISTHVGVMHAGNLVAQGAIAELKAGTRQTAQILTDRPTDALRVLGQLGLSDISADSHRVTGVVGDVAVEKIVPALVHEGVPVLGFNVQAPSLEDLFVSLTGEGFDVRG